MTTVVLRQGTQRIGPGPRIVIGRIWINEGAPTVDLGVRGSQGKALASLVVGESVVVPGDGVVTVLEILPGQGSHASVVLDLGDVT